MSIKSEKDWLYREITKQTTTEQHAVEWSAGGEHKSGMYAARMDPTDPRSMYAAASGKNRNLSDDQF